MDSVLTSVEGKAGSIVLNRPARLNALDLEMFTAILDALVRWRDDARVELVVVQGNGRAFSAGGDIRAVRDALLRGDDQHNEILYRTEYAIDELIAGYPKPYVALIDGICMGGGIGLAIHGAARIVTERALLAMPETAIGFFPDVGCSYALPRLPGALGMYVALTGARLGAEDACYAGLATHRAPASDLAAIEARLHSGDLTVLDPLRCGAAPAGSELAERRAAIDRCFGGPSVAAILGALDAEGDAWARATATHLRGLAPFALCVTFALMQRGATLSVAQSLQTDLALGRVLLHRPDFIEGVRAVVIDKDRAAGWSPAHVDEVDLEQVDATVRAALPLGQK